MRLGAYVPLELAVERPEYVLTHFADQLDRLATVYRQRLRVRRMVLRMPPAFDCPNPTHDILARCGRLAQLVRALR